MRGNFNNFAFLELYRDLPVLWDRNHPDYKNRKARAEAEVKMLEHFEFDCTRDLRNKIRSLRNTYNLELQRIHASIKNGADPDDAYSPKLAWFSLADSFLGKNIEETMNETWNEPSENGIEETAAAETIEPNIMVDVKSEPTRKRFKKHKDLEKRKFKKYSFASYNEPSSSYQSCEEMVGANEFVVFGQHVAIQLEKLPLEAAVQLQEEIQSLITRARLNSIRSAGHEEQPQATYLQKEHDPISSEDSSS